MKNYYTTFLKLAKEKFEKLKADYVFKIDIGRKNKEKRHNKYFTEANEYNMKLHRENNNYSRFLIEIEDEMEDDYRIEREAAFNQKFEMVDLKERDRILLLLSEFEAYNNFFKYLHKEAEKFYQERSNNIDNVSLEYRRYETEKIEWLGTQKELGELFIELENKGWITEKKIHLIKAYFTKSNTIQQVLKPAQDKTTYKNLYSEVYTIEYEPSFNEIKPNKKQSQ